MSVSPRKPGTTAQALLQELADGKRQNIGQLASALNASKRQVSDAAALLARRSLLTRPALGIYQLTEAGCDAAKTGVILTSGPKGPRGKASLHRDTFRVRAWRSMRIRRRFTIGEIVSDAAHNTEKNARNNALRYVGLLRRAGYVRELPRRQQGNALTSNGFKIFALIRDTGPQAPVWQQEKRAFHDFNTGEDVHVA